MRELFLRPKGLCPKKGSKRLSIKFDFPSGLSVFKILSVHSRPGHSRSSESVAYGHRTRRNTAPTFFRRAIGVPVSRSPAASD